MKTVAIIQARMSSTRLPGKVLLSIAGKPILYYVYVRTKRAELDKVIVATSTDKNDEPIVSWCNNENITVFRGSLQDVLARYYFAAKSERANRIIRITADCPLIDGDLISEGLVEFQKQKPDYLSNTIKRTFPRGFDFEIFTFKTLEAAYKDAKEAFEREHVTPYIYRSHPEEFKISHFAQVIDKSAYQVTVDTPEDYQLLKILIEKYHADSLSYQQIISLLDTIPELLYINQHVSRKNFDQ